MAAADRAEGGQVEPMLARFLLLYDALVLKLEKVNWCKCRERSTSL
jgi:hypothetical protein